MKRIEDIDRPQFSGHETFPLRSTWLPKAVAALELDPRVFLETDAMVRFGVGKNMVRAMRHWAVACGVAEEVPGDKTRGALQPSLLGRKLFGSAGWDRFLEDPATLWLLHWNLASSAAEATTWYWVFSHAPQLDFTRDELIRWLLALGNQRGWMRLQHNTVKRDVDVFVRTYAVSNTSKKQVIEDEIDSPLTELGLLRPGTDGRFALVRSPKSTLPNAVFAYAMIRYLEGRGFQDGTVPLEHVAFAPGSPGRVFTLTESALLSRLERLEALTDGAVVFDDTAGLRQLMIRRLPDAMALLAEHYQHAEEQAA